MTAKYTAHNFSYNGDDMWFDLKPTKGMLNLIKSKVDKFLIARIKGNTLTIVTGKEPREVYFETNVFSEEPNAYSVIENMGGVKHLYREHTKARTHTEDKLQAIVNKIMDSKPEKIIVEELTVSVITKN